MQPPAPRTGGDGDVTRQRVDPVPGSSIRPYIQAAVCGESPPRNDFKHDALFIDHRSTRRQTEPLNIT